ncbi:MAG: NAD(P)-dependent oxidoreductase [Candidatus Gracilibacteria bacterium]|nr:NAD(P)-dependent oxidoreductase [Candidatus Gracilibacteria bacterium]MDD5178738.1 NAD(P)-dependent oxidoreductase [Candidatus Gracilibacteria bacterium]
MESKIYFFEVEPNEKVAILKNYPQAICFEEVFSAKFLKRCSDAEIICGFIHSDFSGENLKRLPKLKLLITRSAGFDHIDLAAARKLGIAVCNVADYGSHVIAEHTFALLLAATRNIVEGNKRAKGCDFCYQGLCGETLRGKTLGVVGVGKIGSKVCGIASRGFGMEVIAFDKYPDAKLAKKFGFRHVKSLSEIWRKSDIITLHTPLTHETKHLINSKNIAQMKTGVILVNTARGSLIDTAALVKAIKAGKFRKVALDVIENEKNPKLDKVLLNLPEVIATPHIAFYADTAKEKMYCAAFESIEEFRKQRKLTHQIKST